MQPPAVTRAGTAAGRADGKRQGSEQSASHLHLDTANERIRTGGTLPGASDSSAQQQLLRPPHQPGAGHRPPNAARLAPPLRPAGTLQRDFKHLAVDMFLAEEEGQKVLKVDCHFGKRKALASIRTCTSHVQVGLGTRGAGWQLRSSGMAFSLTVYGAGARCLPCVSSLLCLAARAMGCAAAKGRHSDAGCTVDQQATPDCRLTRKRCISSARQILNCRGLLVRQSAVRANRQQWLVAALAVDCSLNSRPHARASTVLAAACRPELDSAAQRVTAPVMSAPAPA